MKRRLFKLVVFLLLGAIVNVAVAWAAANTLNLDLVDDLALYPGPNAINVSTERTNIQLVPVELFASRFYVLKTFRSRNPDPSGALNAALSSAGLPSWVKAKRRGFLVAQLYEAHGWPSVALSSAMFLDVDTYKITIVDRAITLGGPPRGKWLLIGPLPRVLPYGVIWPGFAINTAFYAMIVWMLWLSPFVVRRVIRRKRGHCIKCGYDLCGDFVGGCPECGWRRPQPPLR